MSKIVEIQKHDLLTAYREGSDTDKALLRRLFPGELKPLMERVTSIEDICAEAAVDPADYDFNRGVTEDARMDIANKAVDLIYKVVNKEVAFKANYTDRTQKKYFNYYEYVPGSGFRLLSVYYDPAKTYDGARRLTYSPEAARWIGTTFIDIINVALGG